MKKTIKIIDLLNKMANGEELPKKIKYHNKIYIKRSDCHWYILENGTFDDDLFVRIDCLNDEVEILDEEEFEDIEMKEMEFIGASDIFEGNEKYWTNVISKNLEYLYKNQCNLIKNQKKIIEKLNKSNSTQ